MVGLALRLLSSNGQQTPSPYTATSRSKAVPLSQALAVSEAGYHNTRVEILTLLLFPNCTHILSVWTSDLPFNGSC